MRGGFGVEVDVEEAEAAVFVGEGSLHDGEEIVLGEGLEGEDLRAGDEGAVDVEEGVVGGGADEAEGAAFDVGEEDVLLSFVEAVDFVDKEDGGAAVEAEVAGGGFSGVADVGDVAFDAAEVDEVALGFEGDDVGEGGFADAGGAVEEEGGEAVGLDGAAEEHAGGDEVLLAGVFVEAAGADAGG